MELFKLERLEMAFLEGVAAFQYEMEGNIAIGSRA